MNQLHEDISTGSIRMLADRVRKPETENRKPRTPLRHRHHRHGLLPARRQRRADVLGERAGPRQRHHGSAARSLGLAAVLRRRTRRRATKFARNGAGFSPIMPFDPLLFGMPPNSLTSIEPVQLYALETVRRALADAGYADRPFDRERTAVILGAGGGAGPAGHLLQLPLVSADAGHRARLEGQHRRHSAPGRDAAAGVDGGFLPRHPHQRHRRPRRQSLQLRRAELLHRCRVRLVAGRAVCRRPRVGDGHQRHGRGHGRGHGAESVHLHGLQQDARFLAARPLRHLRRGRRRHRHQRRRRRGHPQAPGRRRARRRSHLRRHQGRRRFQRRQRQGADRTAARRPTSRLERAYAKAERLAGARRVRRGARHRHRGRRSDRGCLARPHLPRSGRRAAILRYRLR